MRQFMAFVVACLSSIGLVMGAEVLKPESVQGLYEGVIKTAAVQQKVEARAVAIAKGNYKLLIRQSQPGGKVLKIELAGTADGKFTGQGWSGTYVDGTIKGAGESGAFELKRVVRESPTLGAKPPTGAIVLLDGKDFAELVKRPLKSGEEQEWKVVEPGAIEVPKGGMNSKRQFAGSIKLHVEFKCPLMPAGEGQGRANSGNYLPNGEEIQVLDSFGMTTYEGGGCGGLYRYKDPDVFDEFSLASAPPLQWQTYDIEYRVEKKDGKLVGKPKVTVFHNGIKIHNHFEMKKDARPGGLHWQDHNNPVQYRNIWVLPLDEK